MTNYNDGKWHGWNGGECPVHPKSLVQFIAQNNIESYTWYADVVTWDHKENPVIAFRVIKEHRDPREWWVHPYVNDVSSLPTEGYVHVREVIE